MQRKEPKGSNIVQLAVKPPEDSQMTPSFLHFDQTRKLQDIIDELCKGWNIPNPEQHALQYDDSNTFINEQNRHELINGAVLVLGISPEMLARTLYEDIKSGDNESSKRALTKLATASEDPSFALEFINLDGLRTLLYMVEGGIDSSELRAHVLTAFQELMEHNIVTWDIINNVFVKKTRVLKDSKAREITIQFLGWSTPGADLLCSFVSTTSLTDPTVLKRSLSILEAIVQNSPNFYAVVSRDVTIDSLIQQLHNVSEDVKINTIALINALILKTPPDRRKHLASEILSVGVRNVLLTNIIRKPRGVSDEMAHQLYTYQQLTLNFLQARMSTPMREEDQAEKDKIENLRKAVFESNIVHFDVQMRTSKDYRKLGFEHYIKLSDNFRETPPGLLPLDCMTYFSKQYPDSYIKVVLENMGRGDGHECPFGKSSIALVKLLCRLLNIGEQPDDTSSDYYPIFFSTESPFYELFCICITLLGKTWREMKAKSEDFGRVMSVVEKQIKETLKEKQPTLDVFKTYINNLKVDSIIIGMIQGSGTSIDLKSKPVAHLRERIVPALIELVKNQRLNLLAEGTRFEKQVAKRKAKDNKYWYCRLSQNRRFLHHGNCEEGSKPNTDQLPNKIALIEVEDLKTGADCPHTQEAIKVKKTPVHLAFSLIMKEKPPLNFIAPNQETFDIWVDGLSILIGKNLQSKTWESDLNSLVEMEMKLRLLDLENVKIPEEAPPIPPEPPGYEFRYNFN